MRSSEKNKPREIFKLREEDKYCFRCRLSDCKETNEDCLRKIAIENKRNNKYLRGIRF